MDRKIRFKCWDGEKMWKYAVPLLEPAYNGGMINVSDKENGSFNHIVNGVLLQYTGMNDSKRTEEYPNGQEIYEGDIIRDISGHTKNLIVVFLYGGFKCSLSTNDNNISSIPFYEGLAKTIEVIGNIYENKQND